MKPEIPVDVEDIDRYGCGSDADDRPAVTREEGIVHVKQGVIQKSNAAMARLSGYRHEEVVDTIFASFFHLDDIPLVKSICDRPKKTASGKRKPIVRLIDKNGNPIPVEISVARGGKGSRPARRIKIRHI